MRKVFLSIIFFTFVNAQSCSKSTPCSDGSCCSQYGYCGTTNVYCDPETCQANCWSPKPTSVSKCANGCGAGQCCSNSGYCGSTDEYCGPGNCDSFCPNSPTSSPTPNTVQYVYIGTYQDPPNGVVVLSQNQNGELRQEHVVSAASASSLAAHPTDKTLLFGISEFQNSVKSWRVKSDGDLALISQVPSGGDGPAFVKVHTSGKWVFSANYGSGHFSVFPVDSQGQVKPFSDSVKPGSGSQSGADNQKGPHAHMITTAPNGLIAGCDLGSDAVFFFNLTANGKLNVVRTYHTNSNTGPRHIVFNDEKELAYVIGENGNNVYVFNYNDQDPKTIQVISSLEPNYNGPKTFGGEIRIHQNKFIYVTNRGANTVVVLAIDQDTGKLTFQSSSSSAGDWPRGMNLDPAGRFLYIGNQNNQVLSTFRIKDDGNLDFISKLMVDKPVDIEFL